MSIYIYIFTMAFDDGDYQKEWKCVVYEDKCVTYAEGVECQTFQLATTERMPRVHGAPVCIGEHEKIGIHDLYHPDFGDMVTVKEGEIPVFWPCGVTPQSVVMNTCPPFAITHAPGHMLIADVKNADLMD